MRVSLIIPLLLFVASTITYIKLWTYPPKSFQDTASSWEFFTATITKNQPIIWQNFLLLLTLILSYIISVLFFSLETLIKIYIIDKESDESKRLKSQFESAPLFKRHQVLADYETNSPGNRVTHSVIFQVALLVFTFFVTSSSSSIIGTSIVLSLSLMILVDQAKSFRANQQINSWFWQVQSNISRNAQQGYFAVCAVVYFFLLLSIIT
jgi:hypothetical protein